VASALVGAEPIHLTRAIGEAGVDRIILFRIRLPRALLAMVVGAALAAAGTVLQALLRNPLADPHMLGVSGGAAVGAAAMLMLGGTGALPAVLVPIGAFGGGLLAMLVVYRVGSVHGRLQPYMFLLAGVVTNAFCGALIMALNALADFSRRTHPVLLLGSLQTQSCAGRGERRLCPGRPRMAGRHARRFNALSLGEERGQLGVDVARVRRTAFVISSLLVGAAVSVSGTASSRLIVPHITRLLIGADHRLLLPASALTGATPCSSRHGGAQHLRRHRDPGRRRHRAVRRPLLRLPPPPRGRPRRRVNPRSGRINRPAPAPPAAPGAAR
jgi:iron complex transport system permease protein